MPHQLGPGTHPQADGRSRGRMRCMLAADDRRYPAQPTEVGSTESCHISTLEAPQYRSQPGPTNQQTEPPFPFSESDRPLSRNPRQNRECEPRPQAALVRLEFYLQALEFGMRISLLFVCIGLLSAMTEEQSKVVFPALQAAADRLPLLQPAQADGPAFQILSLNADPVRVGDLRVDACRIHVPEAGGDLIWAFATPNACSSWYIIPVSGTGSGFENFHWAPCLAGGTWTSDPTYTCYVQSLSEKSLKAGQDYIIWFEFTNDLPTTVHARLRFVPHAEDEWTRPAIMDALQVQAADMDEQVQRFHTRGGALLRDNSLIGGVFGEFRLMSLLHGLAGEPISLTVATPDRLPSHKRIRTVLGEPDLIVPHDPLLESGLSELGDTPFRGLGVTLKAGNFLAFFDHVVISYRNPDAKIDAVAVLPWNAALASAHRPGNTVDALPGGLYLLHQEGALQAVAHHLGGAEARCFGPVPAGSWHAYSEAGWIANTLTVDENGTGTWTFFSYPGMRSEQYHLQSWRKHGEGSAFYPDGSTRAHVHYADGLLDGKATWYKPDGTISGTRTYKAGKVKE